jgi:hypothetical protein
MGIPRTQNSIRKNAELESGKPSDGAKEEITIPAIDRILTVVEGKGSIETQKTGRFSAFSPREKRPAFVFNQLLLGRCAALGRPAVTIAHPFMPGLHFVPLLLLISVEQPADLVVGALADIHHLRVAILLRKRRVLVQALHLRVLRLQGTQHFSLLIGGEVEMFGQFGRALGGVGRTVMPSTVLLHGRGLRAVGILSAGKRRRKRNKTCCGEDEQGLFEHRDLLFKNDSIYTYERNYEPRVAQETRIRTIFA